MSAGVHGQSVPRAGAWEWSCWGAMNAGRQLDQKFRSRPRVRVLFPRRRQHENALIPRPLPALPFCGALKHSPAQCACESVSFSYICWSLWSSHLLNSCSHLPLIFVLRCLFLTQTGVLFFCAGCSPLCCSVSQHPLWLGRCCFYSAGLSLHRDY